MANVIPVEITREIVRTLVQTGAQLVEVLSKEQYENIHLTGAIDIPLDSLNRRTVEKLKRDEPIIVYCYDYQ